MNDRAIETLCRRERLVVLDGGLATELEDRGHDLNDPLWSAKVLIDDPDAIREVHAAYFRAGAECATTATYQASFTGFARRGLDASSATQLFHRAVDLAVTARDATGPHSTTPMIAGSLGSYGACLGNGSEFSGQYDVSASELAAFHRPRIKALIATPIDVVAFETIPRQDEAILLARLLSEFDGIRGWISFSCRDAESTGHGEDLAHAVAALEPFDGIIGVGINCTAPVHVEGLVRRIRGRTQKAILVYPNSGEQWETRRWTGRRSHLELAEGAPRWRAAGADAIGGCCRTTPEHIAALARP